MENVDIDTIRDNMFAKVKAATLDRIFGTSTIPVASDDVECRTIDFRFGTGKCWTDPDMPRNTPNMLDNRSIAIHNHAMHECNGHLEA